jgi:hypothetical protein
MSQYVFRPAEEHEVPAVFELIMARVRWMDEVGIRQWNVTDYAGCYPPAHYEAARQRGDLFVLTDDDGIAACAVLRKDDERWPEAIQSAEPAFYLHHLKGEGIPFGLRVLGGVSVPEGAVETEEGTHFTAYTSVADRTGGRYAVLPARALCPRILSLRGGEEGTAPRRYSLTWEERWEEFQ